MSKIEIEITDDNDFNTGWLGYLLGLDRPKVEPHEDDGGNSASVEAHGWDMAKDTPACVQVRHVFTRQNDIDHPQYVVRRVFRETGVIPPERPVKTKVTIGE